MKKETGKVISAFRKHFGYTQQFVADKLHITTAALANIENGRVSLDIEKLYLVSKIFGIPERLLLSLIIEIYEKGNDDGLIHAVEQLKVIPIDDF